MYPQYTEKSGKNEVDYFQSLYSERMDNRPPATQPRLRYAILAQARTGSELIAAYLRRRGVGLPLEYFHDASMVMLAARWGCLDASGAVDFARYRAELERHRTGAGGVFGIKIMILHLGRVAGGNLNTAAAILGGFDKVLLVRRRDTLRQAISLMRAMSTGQWHVLPGDEQKPVTSADLSLSFARVTYCWALVLNQEREMARLEATLPEAKQRTVWYEDLVDPTTMSAIAAWLGVESGNPARPVDADHPLPIKGDSREADAIMKAYLDYISVMPP
jgi:hypothetical protein